MADMVHEELGDFLRMRPKDIAHDMRRDQHAAVPYHTAMRPRVICGESTSGTIFQAYKALPSYLATIEHQNPSSQIQYRIKHGRFHGCFIAYAASIIGVRHCRPLTAVDVCPLKGHFCGQTFSAVTRDANNGIFSLAFGILDQEEDQN